MMSPGRRCRHYLRARQHPCGYHRAYLSGVCCHCYLCPTTLLHSEDALHASFGANVLPGRRSCNPWCNKLAPAMRHRGVIDVRLRCTRRPAARRAVAGSGGERPAEGPGAALPGAGGGGAERAANALQVLKRKSKALVHIDMAKHVQNSIGIFMIDALSVNFWQNINKQR